MLPHLETVSRVSTPPVRITDPVTGSAMEQLHLMTTVIKSLHLLLVNNDLVLYLKGKLCSLGPMELLEKWFKCDL